MTGSASLNAARRAEELERLIAGEMVDVLVVGGGISGVGVALDAASRGLSVALLERRGLAFGTSRWSSKLIHGGLRYLAHGDFGLAWQSARERAALMGTIALHLVRPRQYPIPPTQDNHPTMLDSLPHRGTVNHHFSVVVMVDRLPRGTVVEARFAQPHL